VPVARLPRTPRSFLFNDVESPAVEDSDRTRRGQGTLFPSLIGHRCRRLRRSRTLQQTVEAARSLPKLGSGDGSPTEIRGSAALTSLVCSTVGYRRCVPNRSLLRRRRQRRLSSPPGPHRSASSGDTASSGPATAIEWFRLPGSRMRGMDCSARVGAVAPRTVPFLESHARVQCLVCSHGRTKPKPSLGWVG